jgi:Co/Zn/Cd efflux system component
MRLRLWTSLTLVTTFCVLAVSGLFMFFTPYSRTLDSIHSVFGTLFILVSMPHLYNNFKSLLSYLVKSDNK